MADIAWPELARDDLRRLYQFIVDINSSAAAKMLRAILTDIEQLSEFPELGRLWDTPTQERQLVVPFGARAYLVRYRYQNNLVFITRVWHGSEDAN